MWLTRLSQKLLLINVWIFLVKWFLFFNDFCQWFVIFNFFKLYLFIYFWLCWVFVSVPGLSLVAAGGGHSSSQCAGLSLSRPLLLQSTGSRRAGSVIVAHGSSCSAACGIFPDQGSNPCPLHWQTDSQPLCHQGSPSYFLWSSSFLHLTPRPVCGYDREQVSTQYWEENAFSWWWQKVIPAS